MSYEGVDFKDKDYEICKTIIEHVRFYKSDEDNSTDFNKIYDRIIEIGKGKFGVKQAVDEYELSFKKKCFEFRNIMKQSI